MRGAGMVVSVCGRARAQVFVELGLISGLFENDSGSGALYADYGVFAIAWTP